MLALCRVRKTKYAKVSHIDRSCEPATWRDMGWLIGASLVFVLASIVVWNWR